MSGRKYSEIELQRERRERLQLEQELKALTAETDGLKQALADCITGMSEGLRSTFDDRVQAAEAWRIASPPAAPSGASQPDATRLRRQVEQQRTHVERGRTALRTLELARTETADRLAQALAARTMDIRERLLRHAEILRLWLGAERVDDWQSRLATVQDQLVGEHYRDAGETLDGLDRELDDATIAQVTDQEAQHQRRLYLLGALRQVCIDLGFAEQQDPAYEAPGDRGSRIRLVVDTHDRGVIAFHLGLDGLSALSDLAMDHCPLEFGTLSQHLSDRYGIQTRFRSADGAALPQLRQKGEKDLPDDDARHLDTRG